MSEPLWQSLHNDMNQRALAYHGEYPFGELNYTRLDDSDPNCEYGLMPGPSTVELRDCLSVATGSVYRLRDTRILLQKGTLDCWYLIPHLNVIVCGHLIRVEGWPADLRTYKKKLLDGGKEGFSIDVTHQHYSSTLNFRRYEVALLDLGSGNLHPLEIENVTCETAITLDWDAEQLLFALINPDVKGAEVLKGLKRRFLRRGISWEYTLDIDHDFVDHSRKYRLTEPGSYLTVAELVSHVDICLKQISKAPKGID